MIRPNPRPFGPYPLESDGRSVKIPVRVYADDQQYTWARVDVADLPRVLAHKWRQDIEGYPLTTVYVAKNKTGLHLYLHRMVTNAPAGRFVDHKHGDRLDARRRSLRFATPSQNSANRREKRPGSLSQYRGVTLHRKTGKWQAQAKRDDRFVYGGLHVTEDAAARAYNVIARRLWGRFAVLNDVQAPPAIAHSTPEAAA